MCTNQDSFLTQSKAALHICGTKLDDKWSMPLTDHDDCSTELTLTHALRPKPWTCLLSPMLSPSDLSGFMCCCLCFQSETQIWILAQCQKHKHVRFCIVECAQLCCPFVFAEGQKGKLISVQSHCQWDLISVMSALSQIWRHVLHTQTWKKQQQRSKARDHCTTEMHIVRMIKHHAQMLMQVGIF